MKVAVIGTGYVGLTTAVALALSDHLVVGIDLNEEKIEALHQGKTPIYEPGLDEALIHVQSKKMITFTTDFDKAVQASEIIFICVGTPSDIEGKADLGQLYQVIRQLRRALQENKTRRVIVVKSTVPPGTCDQVAKQLADMSHLTVASNPEFLREGKALLDSMSPSRIVLGTESEEAFTRLVELYEKIPAIRLKTTPIQAELIKYASNAFLSMRISFMNELARLCDKIGADITAVAVGMGLDSRIGPEFLQAGLGYGGSCFPKDTLALLAVARENNQPMDILYQVTQVNETQPLWFLHKIEQQLNGCKDKTIAILGLAFKPETDDIREAPSIKIIQQLLDRGAKVKAYDTIAMTNMKVIFSEDQITYESDAYEAVKQADALILCTEWDEFKQLDFERVYRYMKNPLVCDGRNALPRERLHAIGFKYLAIGLTS
ncbi:UDP-glucose dehydrogenase family protein [Brevibacillus daliensis]|uniref:UDP-glucose dehydrogenase family protein n=1 Tax=Brevibacillus daliensis TaxID=2892995 RepID=UPI001E360D54|nr:UDP-glucose/GDP-mannose dehydrogenase family protein [Brevibacillus daliensis]